MKDLNEKEEKQITETRETLGGIKRATEIILPDSIEVETIKGERVTIQKPSLRKQIPLIQEVVKMVSEINEFKGLDFKNLNINQIIEIFVRVIPNIAHEKMAQLVARFFLNDEDFRKDNLDELLKEKQEWILDNLEFASVIGLVVPFLISQVKRTSEAITKIIKIKAD